MGCETGVSSAPSVCNGPRLKVFHGYFMQPSDGGGYEMCFVGGPHETADGAIRALRPLADAHPETTYHVGEFALLLH